MAKHPAVWSPNVLQAVIESIPADALVLDPFAGNGWPQACDFDVVGTELEWLWASEKSHDRSLQANALYLPFASGTFDVIATSPCFGNRFADHHNAKDASTRRSYTHDARAATGDPTYRLHGDNAGTMQWGPAYRQLHLLAWLEAVRCLKPDGRFILNVKDHYRNRVLQRVTDWHVRVLTDFGLWWWRWQQVPSISLRYGENPQRAETESVIELVKER